MKISNLNKNTVLKNGIIIDPYNKNRFKGDLWLQNGLIKEIGHFDYLKSAKVIDCSEKIITHGFCDLHVHFREPGYEHKETLQTGSQAAMAGGFTRVCVMPNTNPPLDSPESISFTTEKASKLPIYIHPIGAVTKGQHGKELTEMALMVKEGAVAFSDDGLPIQDGGIMRIALEYSTLINVPIINHAEDECLRSGGIMNEGKMSTILGLSGNPDLSESNMVHRDLELANFTGARLHVPHVSSEKAIEHIRKMKVENDKVTAEVTPHHLFFNDEALMEYDTNLKVGPPIRTEKDRIALIEAVKDGVIDCIATDHAPHAIEDKETTFDLASFGMIGLESCFGVVNRVLVKENNVPLEDLIDLLTVKPRKIMGFPSDLFLKGQPAEITVFDPNCDWIFRKNDIRSRSKNSPYLDLVLNGQVLMTISRGKIFKR
tara:strand:- start:514 stop:1803 length:1290 start_codon:yes stop_codon:yes gene_type:complete